MLIYQTDDAAFADEVIRAMTSAGVPCDRTGGEGSGAPAADHTIRIFIHSARDARLANAILLKLGATTGRPVRLASRWLIRVAVVLAVALALWFFSRGMPR